MPYPEVRNDHFFPFLTRLQIIGIGLLLLVGLYISSLYNYLLFHSLAEIFSIVIAWMVFAFTWYSRCYLKNNYLLLLGIGFLFIGGLNLVHTLAYKGMDIFQEYDGNLPAQLWIASRYMQSISLLIAPIFIHRKLKVSFAVISYTLISLLLLVLIFTDIFPACYIEGSGLTPFKKISEYIISLILLASTAILIRNREKFDERVLWFLISSILLTIGAELSFTFYFSAMDYPT